MAIYFPTAHATFIHIPKTAGLSFEAWAANVPHINHYRKNKRHMSLAEFQDNVRDPGIVFTFVRNPWARMVSYYYWLFDDVIGRVRSRAEGQSFKGFTAEQDLEWLGVMSRGFDCWLHEVYSHSHTDALARIYLTPQSAYIRGNCEVIAIKLERIKSEFNKIQTLLNCYEPLPVKNVSSSHNHYYSYYSHYGRLLVARVFAEDIERFKYSFLV